MEKKKIRTAKPSKEVTKATVQVRVAEVKVEKAVNIPNVYHPNYKLIDAWKELLFLWKVTYKIALENKKKGEEFPVFSDAKKRYLHYKNYKKIALTH